MIMAMDDHDIVLMVMRGERDRQAERGGRAVTARSAHARGTKRCRLPPWPTRPARSTTSHLSDHAVATDELRVTVTLTADGVVTSTPTDSIGLSVEQTYKLTKSPLAGDQYHYELTRQDG